MPRRVVNTLHEIDELAESIGQSAAETAQRLATLASAHRGLALLHALRFEPQGRQPLGAEPLNLIEQLNQTFTYLASLAGARYLFRKFPDSAPYTLNLGTTPGPDIVSRDGRIVAEVFAAVDPENNDKLAEDIRKVRGYDAFHRFVFFYSPGHEEATTIPPHPQQVTIVSLGNLAGTFNQG